ncbi:MAG: gamma-glutamyltransferase [Gammaproteobacteria bacterium]|nr:gamma-glutamyltransferase [Gammaproteobacteria bacterium]
MIRLIVKLVLLVSLLPAAAQAADLKPSEAAIASAHPLATQAGLDILDQGGNAFDAAVAVSAALAVVEPYGSGLGGGGFYLLHVADSQHDVMLDARETAPASARQSHYLDNNGELDRDISINSAYAAGIPGIPAALDKLAREYGRLPLKETLAPAIRYAQEGFAVTERYRKLAGFRLEVMRRNEQTAAIFLQDNDIPETGYMVQQPQLAETLETIADKGSDVFYRGGLAERMVAGVNEQGGQWTLQDLADYTVKERRPIVSVYGGIKIISASLPSSGGIVLGQALGILEQFDLRYMDEATRMHLIVEAMRRAYRDRAAYLGDSDFVDVPVERLLDADYMAGLAVEIDRERATPSDTMPPFDSQHGVGDNTTHFSIIDTEGNRVSATLSVNLPFGNAMMAGDTGILLNNELDDFALQPLEPNAYGLVGTHANAIAPGKRPLSSMTPTFLETDDKVAILGTPGGSRIISMVLLGTLAFADGGLPESWVSMPRYHHQYLPDVIQHEPGALAPDLMTALQSMGHAFEDVGRRYGNMQAVLWHKPTNLVFVASDPRGEGRAAKLPQ